MYPSIECHLSELMYLQYQFAMSHYIISHTLWRVSPTVQTDSSFPQRVWSEAGSDTPSIKCVSLSNWRSCTLRGLSLSVTQDIYSTNWHAVGLLRTGWDVGGLPTEQLYVAIQQTTGTHVHAPSRPIINTLVCISVKAVHPHMWRRGHSSMEQRAEDKALRERASRPSDTPAENVPSHFLLFSSLSTAPSSLRPATPSDF